ncbi:C9orf72-like protein family-domain-containing protein [Fennellomyces sp. T-0311]|nr:C9orf72-like protein family-domain-containing protein [Fennellomyces sp. T-0311]
MSLTPNDNQEPRSRITKATVSTTAVQPLEITTTAVVNRNEEQEQPEDKTSGSDTGNKSDDRGESDQRRNDVRRKQSHHHHRHHIKSPVFQPDGSVSPLSSPLSSAGGSTVVTPSINHDNVIFTELPPPIVKGGLSEAVVALQDAVNESNAPSSTQQPQSNTATTPPASVATTPSAIIEGHRPSRRIRNKKATKPQEEETLDQLFESCFFSAVLLLQWSNVMGPKMEKVWSADEASMDEKLQTLIGRQVLNGEMGRPLSGVELKWITLHRQAIMCAAFLFNDSNALRALVFVLPLRYLRNFSPYFHVLRDRVPLLLVEPLQQLRKLYRRRNIGWSTALDFFASRCLSPFIRSIMKIDTVSLPLECNKISYNLLDQESRQLFESPFFGRVVTSHLQTLASSVLLGNSLTTMNMMINTLSLFLSPDERNRSSHARKNLKYMADLYLQGLLIQDLENMHVRLEVAVLDSNVPTTVVDMTRLTVKQTPLLPSYRKIQQEYRDWRKAQLEDDLARFLQPPSERSVTASEWKKQSTVFHKVDSTAPMVKTLLNEVRAVPTRLREAYVRQWRRWLVRRAVAFIQFCKEEGRVLV